VRQVEGRGTKKGGRKTQRPNNGGAASTDKVSGSTGSKRMSPAGKLRTTRRGRTKTENSNASSGRNYTIVRKEKQRERRNEWKGTSTQEAATRRSKKKEKKKTKINLQRRTCERKTISPKKGRTGIGREKVTHRGRERKTGRPS